MAFKKYAKRRPVRRPRRKTARPRATFARRVRKVVTRMAEKKQTTTTQLNINLTSADTSVLMNYVPLAPILAQTSAENGRDGNEVQVTSAKISGQINMLPYNSITNTFPNIKVKLWLVSYKNRNSSPSNAQDLGLSDFSTFFENGSSGVPPQGTLYDMWAPVNSSRWTVHATKTMNLSIGNNSATGTYQNTTAPAVGNGNYQAPFSFNFGKHLGKLIYDDNNGSNYPTNKNCFLLIQPVTSDGSARQAGPIAKLHYRYDVRYTDL